MKSYTGPIYTADLETDPFQHQRTPVAFAAGVYAGPGTYKQFWSSTCIGQLFAYLATLEAGIIYIHNGGRFDLFVADDSGNSMLQWIAHARKLSIINSRVVACDIPAADGWHSLRDSFTIMPFALARYKKDEIDITKLELDVRYKHRTEIENYLRGDCIYLWELCADFVKLFGPGLTVGGTAMRELRKLHDFDCLTEKEDKDIRSKFYFGGRVQCFESGIVKPHKGAQFNVYDINQSYPNAMRNFDHPIGRVVYTGQDIDDACFFLTVEGVNKGAFPTKTKDALRFDVERGTFNVSIHEFNAAIETGMFELHDIVETYHFDKWGRFEAFIDWAHGNRKACQLANDDRGSLFYKYIGNSVYGKFAQCPDNYFDYMLTEYGVDPPSSSWYKSDRKQRKGTWQPDETDLSTYVLWKRESENDTRYNVAIGASITGAARSALIRALATAKRPLYCDTDSIICESLHGVTISDTQLGAWKIEKSGNRFCIGGKKLYALMNMKEQCTCPRDSKGVMVKASEKCKQHVKHASKGTRLTPEQIQAVADGATVTYFKDAPTYNVNTGKDRYLKRRVKMTA
jgi:DNA polymerase type B, organellar and viral